MAETKYIGDPSESQRTAEEFLLEFKEHVYPSYASFGFTLSEAVICWKLNCMFNVLTDLKNGDDEKWESP